ncbi:plastocyanin/azurin family copper-binding protein [Natrinema sp. 1APR25-10V2]|uniref:cupredoxin domain-containing protein n=1 Tax=Natrinema sp. 1APR25-10V2 TaxID=2951081 RepID=UPI002875D3BE|nr:plastocyanin/azurin family copper-binding protein [Natrinema sp. 1APR25-10V2]MDS0474331.1 plastocyanin/azurin family copper-binding protein [Natrinema sp. 1APR25-10V2]
MHRRVYLAAVGTAASAGLAGCSSALSVIESDPCSGGDCHIGMNRTEFLPATYEVSVGDTVVWKNTSEADHTVTAYGELIPDDAAYFASGGFEDQDSAYNAWHGERGGRLGSRETYEHTFDVPGTYEYFCIPHERGNMTGEIVVTE